MSIIENVSNITDMHEFAIDYVYLRPAFVVEYQPLDVGGASTTISYTDTGDSSVNNGTVYASDANYTGK